MYADHQVKRRFVPWTLWNDSQEHKGRKGEVMATVKDPVCGMEIDSAAAAASEEYEGKTYYFCSEACHQRFVAAPEQYAV
jgi:YHS domain-containing protein